jgi:hypothetical protein
MQAANARRSIVPSRYIAVHRHRSVVKVKDDAPLMDLLGAIRCCCAGVVAVNWLHLQQIDHLKNYA